MVVEALQTLKVQAISTYKKLAVEELKFAQLLSQIANLDKEGTYVWTYLQFGMNVQDTNYYLRFARIHNLIATKLPPGTPQIPSKVSGFFLSMYKKKRKRGRRGMRKRNSGEVCAKGQRKKEIIHRE